jgi:hypothetical protein
MVDAGRSGMIACRGVHGAAIRGQGTPALLSPAMNTYRIVPTGDEFDIIETYPDGRTAYIGGFQTKAEAQAWLDNYLRVRRLNAPSAGKPPPE